jgi:transposase-like protein
MRQFKCFDCGYVWEVPHGQGGRGVDMRCPKCGSGNVHRVDGGRGRLAWGPNGPNSAPGTNQNN